MIRLYICNISLFCVSALFSVVIHAQSFIQIVDQNGAAVPHAVVLFDGKYGPKRSDQTVIMDQVDRQFKPRVLAIRSGQRVAFPNSDQIRHHVYSFSKPNHFEIKLYSGEEVDPVPFDHAGIVVVGCNIHDQMRGYIYVSDTEHARVSDAQGRVYLDGATPPQVRVWHSDLSLDKSRHVTFKLNTENAPEWTFTLPLVQKKGGESSRKFRSRFQ